MGTVTSIRVGGRTPMAGAFAALVLLALLLGLGRMVEPIPLAVLAGILIKIGWDIIDWRFIKRLVHTRTEYVLVMAMTFVLTVLVDLITAVALGLITSGVLTARRSQQRELDSIMSFPIVDPNYFSFAQDVDDLDPFSVPVGIIRLTGRFTVASSNELVRTVFKDIEDYDVIILDFAAATTVDDSAALAFERLIDSAMDKGVACIVMGLKGEFAHVLYSLAVLKRILLNQFVDRIDEAKQLAAGILQGRYRESASDLALITRLPVSVGLV